MFALIHIVLLTFITPRIFAFNPGIRAATNGDNAFGTGNVIGIFVVATYHLTVGHGSSSIVWVKVIHLEVIENVAAFSRYLSSTNCHATDRWLIVKRPGNFIDGVNGLFHQAIAAQPCEVIPIANLPFHVTHSGRSFRCRWHGLHRRCIVSAVVTHNIADCACVDLIKRLHNMIGVAPAEARHQTDVLFLGHLHSFKNVTDANGICGHRFFHKQMLLRFYGSAQLHRSETRWCGQQYYVHTAINQFLIAIESYKFLCLFHFQTSANFWF